MGHMMDLPGLPAVAHLSRDLPELRMSFILNFARGAWFFACAALRVIAHCSNIFLLPPASAIDEE
eukprot:1010245-Pleurochrysis_carterae.AAC.1